MRALTLYVTLLVVSLLFVACAPASPTAPATPAVVEKTVEVTKVVEKPVTQVVEKPVAVTVTPPATAAPKFAGVTLTMIDNPDGQTEPMIALAKQCQAKTGVKLNTEVVPEDQVNVKLETALAAKQPTYDLFALDIINLPKYAAAGWVAPLDNYLTPEMKADILPFAAQAAVYQNHWLGLPWKAEFLSFIYNKKMLQAAGYDHPPRTLDELVQMSQTLKQKGIVNYPLAFTWGAGYEQITVDWVMFTKDLGGDLFDANGNPVFNKGAGVDALQLMNDMLNKYKIVDPAALTIKGGGTRMNLLTGGKGAFAYLWSAPLVTMNDPAKSKLAGQFDVALAPAGQGGPYSVAGPMAISISAYSKNKDAAWEFTKCIAGPEGEKFMLLQEGAATGWKSVLNDPQVAVKLQKAGGDVIAQQSLFLAVRPALPYYSEWSAQVQKEVQNVLIGQKTAQKALDDLADFTRQLKTKYGQ